MDNDISQDPLLQEREKEKRRTNRQLLMESRANAYFNIYYEMGGERSLMKLKEYLKAVGVSISMNTLERYSSNYSWQIEITKRDNLLNEIRIKKQSETIEQMHKRHIDMAKAGQQVLAGGLKHYLDALSVAQPKEIPIEIISRSLKDLISIERTARGEPAERRELIIQIENTWILTVTQIFLSINDYPTAEMRKEEFGNRLQNFVNQRQVMIESED